MQDVGHLELIWLTVKRTSRVGRSLQNEQNDYRKIFFQIFLFVVGRKILIQNKNVQGWSPCVVLTQDFSHYEYFIDRCRFVYKWTRKRFYISFCIQNRHDAI